MRIKHAAAAVVAIALVATACGDETDSPAATDADTVVPIDTVPPDPDPAPPTDPDEQGPNTTPDTTPGTTPDGPPLTLEPVKPDPTPPADSLPDPPGSVPVPEPGGPVEIATADLAARLGVDVSAITVVSREEVTWNDGSIGCPEPGTSYTQAVVNGSRIILEYAGVEYRYHSAETGDPFYCATPIEPMDPVDASGAGDS